MITKRKLFFYYKEKPLIDTFMQGFTFIIIQNFIVTFFFLFFLTKANESDVKALHPLATAHRPKNHAKNALQQLRSMMPSRGNYKYKMCINIMIIVLIKNV